MGKWKLVVGPEKQASWYGHFTPNATDSKVRVVVICICVVYAVVACAFSSSSAKAVVVEAGVRVPFCFRAFAV